MRCIDAQNEHISSSKTLCLSGAIFAETETADSSCLGLQILPLLNFLLALQQSRLFLLSDLDWIVCDCCNDDVWLTLSSTKLLHLFRIWHDAFLRFEQPILPNPLRVVLLKSSLAMKSFFNWKSCCCLCASVMLKLPLPILFCFNLCSLCVSISTQLLAFGVQSAFPVSVPDPLCASVVFNPS
jgi:hypothetical protein